MAERTMDRAKEFVADTVDKTKEGLNSGLDSAREAFDSAADDMDDRYRKARRVASEKYQAAADGVRRGYAKVRGDVDKISADVTDYVRENPGKSLLIAAGVGFVVGLLLRRNRED
jgi:ElaB/YqjD/DUF883 family membrane-anchored ribosome-binding protein